ncbi:type IV toxin-antitoxin system AbiEi family antitoxin domain-containing protein [Bdellovibrio bacteriovorus]|uniref:type IV toxin-antitoxin system AbiEi family antitoxin domain-containing protein n=1 Tax=Bdellovibrio bacteriovorus TaxID=959 RepID=UPI003CFF73C2
MKPQSALKALGGLLKAQSFTSKEAKLVGVSASTLSHYVKSGALERIGRGVYRHRDVSDVGDLRWAELMDVIHTIKGGVVCLVSALVLYELTDEMPREYWIAISNKTRHRSSRTVRIVRMRDIKLGRTTLDIEGVKIPIFDVERTIVDSFRLLDKETAIKALKSAIKRKGPEKLNLRKLQDYAKKFKVDLAPYLLTVTT